MDDCDGTNIWQEYLRCIFQKEFECLRHPLEERCHEFAKRVRKFCRQLKMDPANIEDTKQLVRASGSAAANYIEANENVGKGDLKYKIKICRKESKEAMHFLGLGETFGVEELNKERAYLIDEASQLKKIFSTILKNILENEQKKDGESG